jgi:DNA-binding response OmpR family regulator
MKKEIGILVVARTSNFLEEIDGELRRAGLSFRARQVDTKEAFCYELQCHGADVIFSNHGLPGLDGWTALALAREKWPDVPFIFVTTSPHEDSAHEEVEVGAQCDALRSPLSKLPATLRRVLREANRRNKLREMELRVLTARWMEW